MVDLTINETLQTAPTKREERKCLFIFIIYYKRCKRYAAGAVGNADLRSLQDFSEKG